MSLSLFEALALSQKYDFVRTERSQGVIRLCAAVRADQYVCPDCGNGELCRSGKRFREIAVRSDGPERIWLVTEVPRCQCPDCGKCFEVCPPIPNPLQLSALV